MAWFRYNVSNIYENGVRKLNEIPGVGTKRDKTGELLVTTHDTAAWLVEDVLTEEGCAFTMEVTKEDLPPIPNIESIVPNGLREWVPEFLTAYQKDGILTMAPRDGMFVWAAGAGKTAGAICWALAYGATPTVVVTKAAVRGSYAREIQRLTTHKALVVDGETPLGDLSERDELFVVLGYEILPAHLDTLLKWKPANVIFDESHKCKSWKRWSATPTQEGKLKFDPLDNIATAAYRLSRVAKRRLCTTASPIKDRVRDLWAQMDLCIPDGWGPFQRSDKASFAKRYCAMRAGAFGGLDTTGAANLDELWGRMSLAVHQVPYSVTHRHLPPKRRVVTLIPSSEQCRAEGFADAVKKAKGRGTSLLELRLMEAAAKKRKAVRGIIEDAIAGMQKVVVFTGRREDCDRLGDEIKEIADTEAPVWVAHGGATPAQRDVIMHEYMASEGPAILVGTGDAWGEGLNLQDTDLALIVMLPYTPGQIMQWEGRFARHGQKRPVMIQYLVAENTVDEHIASILLDKLPAVEDVTKEDSIAGFAGQLLGAGNEEQIINSILGKIGAA